ncbi:hypothetical protein NHX12_020325 [Muraenolepis orangiensis]|uniref:Uncharacterized protein n=1 Tax=Muraenolepis orangiensis TaxID=630683 RepID=A0A9Q0EUV3_9TELE|nr:hypothetical protein NHX12_020325 [Muraenolepis orangiensis]
MSIAEGDVSLLQDNVEEPEHRAPSRGPHGRRLAPYRIYPKPVFSVCVCVCTTTTTTTKVVVVEEVEEVEEETRSVREKEVGDTER